MGGMLLVLVMNSGEECIIWGAFSFSAIIGMFPLLILVFLWGSLYDVDDEAEDEEDAEEEEDKDEEEGLRWCELVEWWFLCAWTDSRCCFKLSTLLKNFKHAGHWNGFSPVCFLIWRARCSALVKDIVQPSYPVHLNVFLRALLDLFGVDAATLLVAKLPLLLVRTPAVLRFVVFSISCFFLILSQYYLCVSKKS